MSNFIAAGVTRSGGDRSRFGIPSGSACFAFAARPYIKLVELISRPEVKSISTESGVNYQIELNVFWDSQPEKNLRILGSIDDGGWRAFLPLTESLIMKPDGKLV